MTSTHRRSAPHRRLASTIPTVIHGHTRPDIPTVAIVPGLGSVGSVERTAAAVGRWTRCVVLDLPGFHSGGPLTCPPQVGDVARLTALWLSAQERPVLLVGHSTGAQAALRAAVAAPANVQGLVLIGPTFAPSIRDGAGLLAALTKTLWREKPSAAAAIVGDFRRAGITALRDFTRSGMADRPEDIIGQSLGPLLIVAGRHDHLALPSWARQLAGKAPGAQVVVLDAAHSMPHSEPDLISGLLLTAAHATAAV